MHINGLNVDTKAIGKGIYEIICEAGEGAIVAFGMIPKWSIDMLQKQLREKIISEAIKQLRIEDEAEADFFRAHIDEEKMAATIRPIEQEICVEIYQAAAKAGRMIV